MTDLQLPPLARTNAEAHLFMQMRPCECGAIDFERSSSVAQLGDELISIYTGKCSQCGATREFRFLLPPGLPRHDPHLSFGEGRSQLLDPGEWKSIADSYAAAVPGQPESVPPEDRQLAIQRLEIAVEALRQMLAFVDPTTGAIATDLLHSSQSDALRSRPLQLSERMINASKQSYEELLARYRASQPSPSR